MIEEVHVRGRLLIVCLFFFVAAVADAQRPAQDASDQLPVRRVVLYKSGVGFFEHVGSVTGNANVTIQFTTAQLNDVLQSLTTLDLDGGSVANISYNSIAPIAQRLSALRGPLGTETDRLEFFKTLRGARVTVRNGAVETAGRILDIEKDSRARNTTAENILLVTLVSDEGSVKTIELTAGTSVHLEERDVREDISSYLGIVASSRGEDVRRMVLAATGTGTRRLAVSYISEVPIWKSTYRLVLPDGTRKPVLQGWAVVDNTIGQDWSSVELSLVAGAPQSFVQAISQPYYVARPIVPLPSAVLLQPQTHLGTLTSGRGDVQGVVRDASGAAIPGTTVRLVSARGENVGQDVSDEYGRFSIDAPPGIYNLVAELSGFRTSTRQITLAGAPQNSDFVLQVGEMSEAVTVTAASPALAKSAPRRSGAGGGRGVVGGVVGGLPEPPAPPPVIDYMAPLAAAADAQDLGDLFEYKLRQPVTIRKNESALVPILNTEVEAERISIWNKGAVSGRPLRGVWLTNSSALTLDGGSFSVVDANAFAGEGLIDSIKPGEKRLVSYGADLAVLVKGAAGDASGLVTKVVVRDGLMIASQEDRATWKYTARNEDASARTLVIEHPLRPGWTVGADPAPAEMSPNAARYRVSLPAKQEASLTLTERHAGATTYRLADFDDRTIAVLVRGGVPEAALRRSLQPLTDK